MTKKTVQLLILVPLLTITACSGATGHVASPIAPQAASSPSPSPVPPAVSASPSPPASVSPLSGRPAKPNLPVLVVKVDNVPGAFPQAGLNDADLVYVEQVEGGLTRLAAVFSSRLPKEVGPTRSARTDNIQLLLQLGRPDIAFSGANDLVLQAIRTSPLRAVDVDTVPSAYTRVTTHVAPHNLFITDPAALIKAKRPDGAKFIELHFASSVLGGRPASGVTVHYPATTLSFAYDKASRRWALTQDGQPRVLTDGSPVQANNVIIERVQQLQDPNGHITPFNQTIGGGPSEVLRDGKVIDGTWRRSTLAAGTHYRDAQGNDIPLEPGSTWIVLVPNDASVALG